MTHHLVSRRSLLVASGSGLAGALASRLFSPSVALAASPPRAKACIVLWLNGGPSHIDTFDPKPGQPTGGPFKAIKTRARTYELSEHLPGVAEVADKISLLRMTSKEGNHQRARYLVHTGYAPNPTVVHPSLGGWVSHELGDKSAELPQFVSVGGPAPGAGFLGVQHGPFTIQKAGAPPANLTLARNVDDKRLDGRLGALAAMEGDFERRTGDPQVIGRRRVYEQSVRLMRSPRTKLFDLSDEPERTVKLYGDSDFGRGCLLARRLVEGGTRLVEVVLDGWDTHKDGFERGKRLSAALDGGFSGLVRDLADRKLLDSTLVVCMGEFGRTPKINGDEGRDHYPQVWTAALAGGGVRGGVAHGKSDAAGAKIVESPTSVPDLCATVFTALGVAPDKGLSTPSGRPIAVTDGGSPVRAVLA
ncbi:MAG: DUF1501 domain-containing protein [Polyangiaceae bacterium]|nr:DUF1501 domain-containing protein [Polyangiaceae bacterium]